MRARACVCMCVCVSVSLACSFSLSPSLPPSPYPPLSLYIYVCMYVESYIYSVVREAVPCALTPREVEEVSAVDGEMTQLRECIQTGKWESCSNQAYKTVKDELTSLGKLVLRGSRIIIQEKLRQKVIDLAHEGHQGIVKTKERLRTKVWWPGIDRDTEKRVKSCHACQVVSQLSRQEPVT